MKTNMDFEKIKANVLYADGSLRDIVIKGTSRQSYVELCGLLSKRGIPYEIEIDGNKGTLDEALAQFDRGDDRLFAHLRFYAGKVCMVCHFFVETELEIDFRPNEVKTQSDWDAVVQVLLIFSIHFQQPIVIHPENCHEITLYEIGAQQSGPAYPPQGVGSADP